MQRNGLVYFDEGEGRTPMPRTLYTHVGLHLIARHARSIAR